MGSSLSIVVGGQHLALATLFGDVEMSTVWPGGSDELSWTVASNAPSIFRGGAPVAAYLGPARIWSGRLTEPDPSQDRMVARGLWRDGDGFVALDGSGNAATTPNTAIDQAIARGLTWTRPTGVSSSPVDLDVSQGPVKLGALLDAWSEQSGQRWGVDPNGQVVTKADDTTPTYLTLPLDNGLGYALDNYASTLVGRYQSSTGYTTATRTDTVAESRHGHVEAIVDLTPRGTITATKANQILDNMLALGRAVPQWTAGIELTYGELLTVGGVPVALETVSAGVVVRIPGGFDLGTRLGGQMYLDVPIGQTHLAGGVLNLQPAGFAGRSLTDVLAEMAQRSLR